MSPLSRLLNLLTRRRDARLTEKIATQVARDCRIRVWARVHRRTFRMSPAQVRGYVRAHAGGMVNVDADVALARHQQGRRIRAAVVARTTEELIDLMIYDLLNATLHGGDWAAVA